MTIQLAIRKNNEDGTLTGAGLEDHGETLTQLGFEVTEGPCGTRDERNHFLFEGNLLPQVVDGVEQVIEIATVEDFMEWRKEMVKAKAFISYTQKVLFLDNKKALHGGPLCAKMDKIATCSSWVMAKPVTKQKKGKKAKKTVSKTDRAAAVAALLGK